MTAVRMIFFDSNVYINMFRSPAYEKKLEPLFQGAFLYVVNKIVLMELWAGVQNKLEKKIIKYHQHNFPLIGFSDDNFIVAGQVLNAMRNKFKLPPEKRRRITWDILIAISARENNALLVTENKEDFGKIKTFLDFDFIGIGKEFL